MKVSCRVWHEGIWTMIVGHFERLERPTYDIHRTKHDTNSEEFIITADHNIGSSSKQACRG